MKEPLLHQSRTLIQERANDAGSALWLTVLGEMNPVLIVLFTIVGGLGSAVAETLASYKAGKVPKAD